MISFETVMANSLRSPPTIPNIWPSSNRELLIVGNLLNTSLVVDAMSIVNKSVNASLLNILPSTYVAGSTVVYNSDPIANCYWPNSLCLRNDTLNFKRDISTCPNANDWGITYDDVPFVDARGNDTPALISALKTANLNASFFVIGAQASLFPGQLKALYTAGQHLGSHTWSHHPLTSLTNEQIVAEIMYTEALVYKETGRVMTYFRPPYGINLYLTYIKLF